MASEHSFLPSELPAPYMPDGYDWMKRRLEAVGYLGVLVTADSVTDGNILIRVDQDNVSKNQLAFDVTPPDGPLRANTFTVNVQPGGSWEIIQISGPVGEIVDVRFSGLGFVPVVQFVIPGAGYYNYQFGPCPGGQCAVEPQMYSFSVAGTRISPVAVLATFR